MANSAANKQTGAARRTDGAASWLAYAASPIFALMGLIAANDAAGTAMCSAGSGLLPVDGMTAMYLLMSLFHLPPWLKLASSAGQTPNR